MNTFVPSVLAIMPESGNSAMLILCLLLVVVILALIVKIISMQGKMADSKKEEQATPCVQKVEPAPVAVAAPVAEPVAAHAPVAVSAPVEAPAPVVEAGVSPKIVAAITAAVECFGEGKYTVRSVARAARAPRAVSQGRAAWGRAAVVSYTEPF